MKIKTETIKKLAVLFIASLIIWQGMLFLLSLQGSSDESVEVLKELHEEELRAEQAIAKYKFEMLILNEKIAKAEEALNQEREARSEAVKRRNEVINAKIPPSAEEMLEPQSADNETEPVDNEPPTTEKDNEAKSVGNELPETEKDLPIETSLSSNLASLWRGSRLEGKESVLISECARSTNPEACVKVIATQTKLETAFGTTGTGKLYNNLTGIQCKGGAARNAKKHGWECRKMVASSGRTWVVYPSAEDSIRDSVRLFVDGNYQSFFDGQWNICGHLKLWGTNQCSKAKGIINSVFV